MSENEPYPEGYLEALEYCTELAAKLLSKVVVVEKREFEENHTDV
jgi:hypothetical protein